MTEYKNLPENYPLYAKSFRKRLPWVFLIFLSLTVYCYYVNGASGFFFNKDVITMMVIFIVVFSVSYIFGKRRQKKMFYSYKLIIDDGSITRQQSNLPDISIPLNEITRIDEMKGVLAIRGPQKDEFIMVWPYIQNYATLRTLLETYRPATPIVYKNIFQKYPALFGVLILLSMSLVYGSNNKIVVAISSIIVLCCIVWTFYKARTSKQVDNRTKKWAWVILIFALSIAATAFKKLL